MRFLSFNELVEYTKYCYLCKNENNSFVYIDANNNSKIEFNTKTVEGFFNRKRYEIMNLRDIHYFHNFHLSVKCPNCINSTIDTSFKYEEFKNDKLLIDRQSLYIDDTDISFTYYINEARFFKNPDIFWIKNYEEKFGDYINYTDINKIKKLIKIHSTFK